MRRGRFKEDMTHASRCRGVILALLIGKGPQMTRAPHREVPAHKLKCGPLNRRLRRYRRRPVRRRW
nr:hypothetical protein BN993_04287 [Virgibacillus halodenitrificans]